MKKSKFRGPIYKSRTCMILIAIKIFFALIALIALTAAVVILLLTKSPEVAKDDDIKKLRSFLDKNELIVDYAISKNRAYVIVSRQKNSEYGDLLLILEDSGNNEWNRIYENDFTGLKPWKIITADIDGDGQEEILTAVRKTTIYDQNDENRLFVFNYSDNILVKKWTGSKIAGRWRSFYAGELLPIPGQELIFIEKKENGREQLSIYYWFDFGFIMLAKSDEYENITKLSISEENLIEIEYDEKQTARLTVKEGKITRADDLNE